jgi:hypothetical protein
MCCDFLRMAARGGHDFTPHGNANSRSSSCYTRARHVRYPAMRWLTIGVFVNIGALAVFPRLRQVGIVRKYNSPTDLVGDRFHCNSLRLVTSLALVVPLFIYATVQFVALADIVEVRPPCHALLSMRSAHVCVTFT